MIMINERHLRVDEFAQRTGYEPATVRKKLLRREISYRKVGRIVLIPESEVKRLLGELRPAIPFSVQLHPAGTKDRPRYEAESTVGEEAC